ncbi:MAG: twin-arginine translocase subunit TatC [Chloroflexi bacterium]|nr:twin-arginine translocase subunit TatC [Chloroflexota bacterium]
MAVQPPTQAPAEGPPPDEPESQKQERRVLTILEHLQELRYRMTVVAVALVVGVAVSFWPLTGWFIDFLKQPAEGQLDNFETFFFDPLEGWTTYFRVSLLLGITISMPVLVYQFLAFIGPGLSKEERRWLYPIVAGASVAFIGGVAFAYYIELPPALGFLLNPPGDIGEPLISVRKYFDFVTRLLLVTGLVFELPLVIMGLAKLGVVTSRKLLGWWRYAIVIGFVAAAIVTPSVDPVTQSLVAGPIIILYFTGILLAKMVEGSPLVGR